jgi:hypothetical protein
MSATTNHVHEGRDLPVPPLTEARGPEGTMDAPPEMEDFCEEIER